MNLKTNLFVPLVQTWDDLRCVVLVIPVTFLESLNNIGDILAVTVNFIMTNGLLVRIFTKNLFPLDAFKNPPTVKKKKKKKKSGIWEYHV